MSFRGAEKEMSVSVKHQQQSYQSLASREKECNDPYFVLSILVSSYSYFVSTL
ncbi:hypothetical protein Hanom_Chr14g01251111 [Helianthus anomalus]